jgi:putative membrane protein
MRSRTLIAALLVAYALLTVYVLTRGFFGQRFQPFLTPLLTALAFTIALLHASERLGWPLSAALLGLTVGVSLLFESAGVATGWIFGPYHYTHRLGPLFLGLVPYLIPVAWFMMMYPSYVIAARIIPNQWNERKWQLGVAALGALVMTSWDLAMDPMMVAGKHWVWEVKGLYFGIPLQNFWGWWLTTFATFVLFLLLGSVKPPEEAQTASGFDRLAIASYAVIGLSTVLTDLEIAQYGPAVIGLIPMAVWIIWSWKKDLTPSAQRFTQRDLNT